jgi:hypothetical protein
MTQYLVFLFDLLLKVTVVKVQNGSFSRHISLLFDLEHSNLVWTYLDTTYISTKFRSDWTSNMATRWPSLFLENELRAIDRKLCTYVPIGKSNSQTKFRFSLISGLATRGAKTENIKKCYDSWTNGWIIIFLYTFRMGEGTTKRVPVR